MSFSPFDLHPALFYEGVYTPYPSHEGDGPPKWPLRPFDDLSKQYGYPNWIIQSDVEDTRERWIPSRQNVAVFRRWEPVFSPYNFNWQPWKSILLSKCCVPIGNISELEILDILALLDQNRVEDEIGNLKKLVHELQEGGGPFSCSLIADWLLMARVLRNEESGPLFQLRMLGRDYTRGKSREKFIDAIGKIVGAKQGDAGYIVFNKLLDYILKTFKYSTDEDSVRLELCEIDQAILQAIYELMTKSILINKIRKHARYPLIDTRQSLDRLSRYGLIARVPGTERKGYGITGKGQRVYDLIKESDKQCD